MDQQFVPNLSFGPDIVKSIRPHSNLFFDVHLMVSNPFDMLSAFIDAGADAISFHIETTEPRFTFPPKILINMIKKNNLRCGIAIKPKTSFKVLEKYLSFIDYIVVMSVEPGFGGQGYIKDSTKRIAEIKKYLKDNCLERVQIQVDGGIKLHNAKEVILAGGDILVAGSEVFGSKNPQKVIKDFYANAKSINAS